MSLFHERLKNLRNDTNMTQQELADKLSNIENNIRMKKQTISAYENNIEPNIDTLNSIAKIFNVSVDYLTGNSNWKNINEELLHNSKIFKDKTTENLSMYSDEEMSLLETLICNPAFRQLLGTLKHYQSLPKDVIYSYNKLLNLDETPISSYSFTYSDFHNTDLKKEIIKLALSNILGNILTSIDEANKEKGAD